MLTAPLGQPNPGTAVTTDLPRPLGRHGYADALWIVEDHRVALDQVEGVDLGMARAALDGALAEAVQIRVRVEKVATGIAAGRTDTGHEGIAEEVPVPVAGDARARRPRNLLELLDVEGDRVANLRPFDTDRQRDFMSASDRRRDHRPPAARDRQVLDPTTVTDGSEHLVARTDDVSVTIDDHVLERCSRDSSCHRSPLPIGTLKSSPEVYAHVRLLSPPRIRPSRI